MSTEDTNNEQSGPQDGIVRNSMRAEGVIYVMNGAKGFGDILFQGEIAWQPSAGMRFAVLPEIELKAVIDEVSFRLNPSRKIDVWFMARCNLCESDLGPDPTAEDLKWAEEELRREWGDKYTI